MMHVLLPFQLGRNGLFLVMLSVAYAALAGCGPGKEQIVREAVEMRLAEFRKKEMLKCREALLTEAGKTVDSLLLHEALDEVNDSLARLRPFKPFRPPGIPPIDSASVRPIFRR